GSRHVYQSAGAWNEGAMKGLSIGVIAIVASSFAWHQDPARHGAFAGRWVVPPEGDAAFRQVYALEQSGGAVTGRVINATNEQPIVDAAIADGTLTFATVAGRPPTSGGPSIVSDRRDR